MRKAEGGHASVWDRTRKTVSFPEHSQFELQASLACPLAAHHSSESRDS